METWDWYLLGMIVLLASTSSIVSWNIFSFSLIGLNGDLGDRGETPEKCLRGEVMVTTRHLSQGVTLRYNKDWALITGLWSPLGLSSHSGTLRPPAMLKTRSTMDKRHQWSTVSWLSKKIPNIASSFALKQKQFLSIYSNINHYIIV